ncbi:hypothetical protein BA6348_00065 [Brevibacillus agri]|nr:hypothetical protein BA6348_00065 [Brevibacillus agri]
METTFLENFLDENQHWDRFEKKHGRKYDPLSEKKWRNFVTVAIQRMGLSYLYVKGVMMLDGYVSM